jgi:hypothetical protein
MRLTRTITALAICAASASLLFLSPNPVAAAEEEGDSKASPAAGQPPPLIAAPPQPRHPVDPWEPLPAHEEIYAPTEAPVLELSSTAWTPIGPSPLALQTPPSSNSNVSGRITGIAVDPNNANVIYIGAAGGGVWKTTDGGTSWTPLTDNQRTLAIGAVAVAKSNPQVVYAGTGEGNNSGDSQYGRGILKSTDGGQTWTLQQGPGNVFDRMATAQIAVDPTNPNIAYAAMQDFAFNGACCSNTGVYKTTDGGLTWANTTAATIDSFWPWSAVALDRSTPATLYSAHGRYDGDLANGIYKTTNSAGTWPLLATGPSGTSSGRISLAPAPSNSQILYGIVSHPTSFGVFKVVRSDNAGMSFNDLTPSTPNFMGQQGWYDQWVDVDPSNAATVYVAGAANVNSILRSTNSGAGWTDIHTGGAPNFSSPHADHHASAFDMQGRLLIGTDGGIWRLDNPATPAWTNLNGNLSTIQFTGIGLHPTNPNVVVGGSQDNGTEIYTGNAVWLETDGGDGGYAKFSPTNGTRVYHQIPPASFGTNFFRRSDNTGNTWVTKTTSISADLNVQNFYAPFSVDPGNGDRVLYGTNRVWETVNGGDSWTPLSASGVNGFNSGGAFVDTIGIAPSDTQTLYAATGGTFATSSKIFVTTNHGGAWTEHDLPAGNGRVNEIQVDPSNSMIAYAVVNNFGGGHVFRTVNGGTSWTNISGSGAGALPNEPAWSIQVDDSAGAAAPNGRLYLATDTGVFVSLDLGVNWARLGTGLPNAQAVQLDLNKKLHILGVATHGRGAWQIQTPGATMKILSITRAVNGHAILQCIGLPNQVNLLQVSANLSPGSFMNVIPAPAAADATGAFTYDDAGAVGQDKRFYQLAYP